MARIRANYVFGTLDVALAAADTTMSSPKLARLPVVASPDVAAITLHDSAVGTHEVVHVTAHTASATTVTISRAQEGTAAQSWGSGTTWLHGPTAADSTHPYVLLESGQTATNVPASTPVGALVVRKA